MKQLLLVLLLGSCQYVQAQSYRKTNGSVPLHHTVKFSDTSVPDFNPSLISVEHHPVVPGGELWKKKEQLHLQRELKYQELKGIKEKKTRGKALAPEIIKSFAGNTNNGTPLDNDIAVSNSGVVISAVNSNIRCFDDTGKYLIARSVPSLAGLSNFTYTSDPRVLYDPNMDRFIMVFFSGATSSSSIIYVGFSTTNQPGDVWNFYTIGGNPFGDSTWSDYPIISINDKDLFMTFNQVKDNINWQFGFKQSVIWQIDKTSGYNGGPLQYTLWDSLKNADGVYYRNICPAKKQITNMGNDMYLVSVRNVDVSNDSVFLFHIDNTQQSGNAQLSTQVLKSNISYGMPPNAKEGAGQYLMTNDGRVLAAVEEYDKIYFGANSVNPAYANAGVYLGEIKNIATSPSVTGTIFSELEKEYAYPSMTFMGTGPNDDRIMYHFLHCYRDSFPGTSIMYKDNNGDFSDVFAVKNGTSVTNNLTDSTERWGDYTNIQKMYNNPSIAFTGGSYGANNGSRTWIGKIQNMEFINSIEPVVENNSTTFIYPNPISENIMEAVFQLPESQMLQFSIYDNSGALVQNLLQKNGLSGKNKFSFNLSPLLNGNYILIIKGDKGFNYSEKIVTQ